jgi:hypothetical protein
MAQTHKRLSIPPAWSDFVVDSTLGILGERVQHIEEGQCRYVLHARDHLDVLRANRKLASARRLPIPHDRAIGPH